jgi:hypothetical protein
MNYECKDSDSQFVIRKFLAQTAMKRLERKKIIFLFLKERPNEAPFRAYKNSFLSEDLQ